MANQWIWKHPWKGDAMNELDLLKMFRDDVPEPRLNQVGRARVDFVERLALEATPRARRPHPRARWLVAAAAVAVALAIVLPAVLPEGSPGGAGVAAAGVAFTVKGDYVVVTISDPSASAAEMRLHSPRTASTSRCSSHPSPPASWARSRSWMGKTRALRPVRGSR